jgi:fission process protein 1
MSSSEPPSSVDSTDTPYRYAAYAQRVRTILLSAHRYVAYTSDIGESFRPVAHPWLVRSAYGISWAYLVGDVGHEGYKAYLRNRRALAPPGDAHKDATSEQILVGMATGNINMPLTSEGRSKEKDSLTPWPTTEISLAEDYRMVMAKRAVFQSIASMGLPAFTIHSVVKYSGRAVKGVKNTLLRTWFPIGVCIELFFYSSLLWFGSPTLEKRILIVVWSPARSLRRTLPPIPLRPPCRRSR